MSLLGFLFKSKKNMAKVPTKRVKIGKYTVTSHAQNRLVDKKRKLKKTSLLENILFKPLVIEETKFDKEGRSSYTRIGRFATTQINPKNYNINSIWKNNKREAKKYNLEKKGNKYVKKSK